MDRKRLQNGQSFGKMTNVNASVCVIKFYIGDSPSGKATDSDSVIRVFESLIPSHLYTVLCIKSVKPCIFVYSKQAVFPKLGKDWGKI